MTALASVPSAPSPLRTACRLIAALGVGTLLLTLHLLQAVAARCRPMPPFLVGLIVATGVLNTGPTLFQIGATLAVCLVYGCIPAIQETEESA